MRYVILVMTLLLMSFQTRAEEFVDKRFYRIQEEYSRNAGDVKVTPEKVIIGYGDDTVYMSILEGCHLLENKIGKIKLKCKTMKFCMTSGKCDLGVVKNPTPITFEITKKYWSFNEVVYGVWETHGVRIYRTMAVLPEDEYDTPECLDSACTVGKGIYKPGELWTKKSLKPQRIKKVPLFKNNP